MDWLAGVIGIVAVELIGRKHRAGFLLGACNEAVWLYIIVTRELWGLLPLCLVLAWRYTAAYRRWGQEQSV